MLRGARVRERGAHVLLFILGFATVATHLGPVMN